MVLSPSLEHKENTVWVATGHPVGPTGEDVDFAPSKLPSCPKQDPQHSSHDPGWLHHQTCVKQAAQRTGHMKDEQNLLAWCHCIQEVIQVVQDAMLFSLKSVNTVTANLFIGRHLLWTKWVLSPKILCWNLIPSVVSGGRALRWLGPEGGDLLNAISTLMKETPERPRDPLLPCEDRAKWELSTNQEVGSHHILNRWCPDLGFLNLQNCEK